VKLTSTFLFSHINSTYLFSLYIMMMCIIFPTTVRLLQNNECGFPLIFTLTVVEWRIIYPGFKVQTQTVWYLHVNVNYISGEKHYCSYVYNVNYSSIEGHYCSCVYTYWSESADIAQHSVQVLVCEGITIILSLIAVHFHHIVINNWDKVLCFRQITPSKWISSGTL
jgi:hypothetical protein